MLVRSDISGLLLAGLKTQFFKTFTEQKSDYEQIATVVPSDKDTEHYAWLGALPSVREFLDERQVGEFSEYEYQIRNKTWESTVAIDRSAIEDDQYGQVGVRVKSLAQEARAHIDQLVFGLLAAGFNTACYDGQNFFSATHPLGKNSPLAGQTQSNTVTDALTGTSLQAAITAMRRTLNDQGRPMAIQPDTLVVPPEQEWEAWQILNSIYHVDPLVSAGQDLRSNPLRGMLKIVASPYLTLTNNWFVLDTKRAVRAIVLQMRKEFEFEALERTSEEGFMRDKYLYGIRGRYNVGYGDWRCAYGSTGGGG